MTHPSEQPGVSWTALDQVHATAARVLAEHTTSVDGVCPICGTAGVCSPARVAAINFEMAGGSAAYVPLGPSPADLP
jgi:hypothetical protein